MKPCYAFLSAALLSAPALQAQQYCTPSFASGCLNWNTKLVSIGTLDWQLDAGSCSLFDFTALSTDIVPGVATGMTVESGVWCGCAVWVDLNNNGTFESTENLYSTYVGADPSFIYTFDLTIPPGTSPGAHRMRIISPWGSDGTTPGDNGSGPCGAYQYGNFLDFTLNVGSSTGLAAAPAGPPAFSVSPNPTTGPITVHQPSDSHHHVQLEALDGRVLRHWTPDEYGQVDLGDLPAGIYLLRDTENPADTPVRVMKR